MTVITDFGHSLHRLIHACWQMRVSMFRTRQLTVEAAFREAYDIYSDSQPEVNDPDMTVDEFAEQLGGYAEDHDFKVSAQGDFIFLHRQKVVVKRRIYLNSGGLADRLSVAYMLMTQLKALRATAFEFKVLKDNGNRADNVVVYVDEDIFDAVKRTLIQIDWGSALRSEIPAGVKRIANGIGWAEEPGGSSGEFRARVQVVTTKVGQADTVSFGAVMSACVVLALKEAKPEGGQWDTAEDLENYYAGIATRLKYVGIDPLKPHKAVRLDKQILVGRLLAYYSEHHKKYAERASKMGLDVLFREAAEMHLNGELPELK